MLNNGTNESLSELEKITEIIFKNPNSNPELVKKAELIAKMYEDNISLFTQLFEFLINTHVETCQFWILQLLIKITNENYFNIPDEDKVKFRSALIFTYDNCIEKIMNKQYIYSKYCVLYITWLKFDYPEQWNEAFKVIINCTNSTTNSNHKFLKLSKIKYLIIILLDLLTEILLTFNEEIVVIRNNMSDYDITRSNIIKDFMRENCIKNVLEILISSILQNSSEQKHYKKIISNSIKIISQLIDWNDLSLFSQFISIIIENVSNQNLQSEILIVLNAIINKGN